MMAESILSNEWINSLGWTLLHSTWQSLIILLAIAGLLRLISPKHSDLRYAIACAGFLFFVVASTSTFFVIHGSNQTIADHAATLTYQNLNRAFHEPAKGQAFEVLSFVTATLEQNMSFIVAAWAAGFLFFAFRLSSAFWFSLRIRTSALPIGGQWNDYITNTAERLNIRRLISLAQSHLINTPMVIGYLKPVILIPAGMLTGLTTEQLETVFLHELGHIKRHDYLINLFQSVIEAIFFFNPFVWKLSDIIRREREFCCDDLVIRQHGGRKAYAHALTHLAEARLSSAAFALTLGNDKNQLLNRIRRIMEDSARSYSGKSRTILPAILLIGALFCISWLGRDKDNHDQNVTVTEQDTIPEKKQTGARYSRKSIITLDENGQPHEQIVEEFEGDEALRPLIENDFPGVPDISVMPDMPYIPAPPLMPDMMLSDTFPRNPFRMQDRTEWEEFARAFEEIFQKKFEKFYRDHEGDTSDFMKKFRGGFAFPDIEPFPFPDDALKGLEEKLRHLEDLNFEQFRDFESEFDFPQPGIERYEDKLRDKLVEDGYLKEGEPIESLEWNNEKFKVNGKAIKEADLEKYNKLNEEFFRAPRGPHKVE